MPLVRYLSHQHRGPPCRQLVEFGTRDQVCASPREAYTRELVAATPEISL